MTVEEGTLPYTCLNMYGVITKQYYYIKVRNAIWKVPFLVKKPFANMVWSDLKITLMVKLESHTSWQSGGCVT